MIRVFIDGPIVGDIRTDFPASLGRTIRIPIPRRVTVCDCPDGPMDEVEQGPEIVEYEAVTWGPKVALMSVLSKGRTDDQLLQVLEGWTHSNLKAAIWIRSCRDRRAYA